MSDKHEIAEQLWKGAHGQLSPEEQETLKATLERDPEARALADEIEQLHASLPGMLREGATKEQALEARILEAYEQDEAAATTSEEPRGQLIQGPWLSAAWRPALALAACLAILIGYFPLRGGPVAWSSVIVPAEYRGEDGPASAYTSEELNAYADDLEEAVAGLVPDNRGWFTLRKSWRMGAQIRELPDGAVLVSLEAVRPRSDETIRWQRDYPDLSMATGDLPNLAGEIGKELRSE